jgi:hypothetical protein
MTLLHDGGHRRAEQSYFKMTGRPPCKPGLVIGGRLLYIDFVRGRLVADGQSQAAPQGTDCASAGRSRRSIWAHVGPWLPVRVWGGPKGWLAAL